MVQDIKMIADKGSQRYEEYCQNNEVKPTEMKATYFMAGYIQGAKDHLCDLDPKEVATLTKSELIGFINQFRVHQVICEQANEMTEKIAFQLLTVLNDENTSTSRGGGKL